MVIEKITAMQAGLEGTPEWMVGEQLKEICADPDCAGLVEQDLAGDGMGLKECAAKIKAYADEQRKTTKASCVCVPPNVAEGIIRKFYGLPERSAAAKQAEPAKQEDSFLNLEDFL